MTETELKNIITNKLPSLTSDFIIGKYVEIPNTRGVFQIDNLWFIYETDEKKVENITGPFHDNDIIYAIALLLHKTAAFQEYSFSETAKQTIIHNHFRSYAEAKENSCHYLQ